MEDLEEPILAWSQDNNIKVIIFKEFAVLCDIIENLA